MKQFVKVKIIGMHPHAGEYGEIEVVDGKVDLIAPLGIGNPDMVLINLENCQHGERGCYASKKNINIISTRKVT